MKREVVQVAVTIGEIRPSQLMFSFGVGSLVDLPNLSAMVMGLDDWNTNYAKEISEDRLIAALQRRLGAYIEKLYLAPMNSGDGDSSAIPGGIPVAPFPRWLRCTTCSTLASIESGVFQLKKDRFRPDRTRYVHGSCTKGKDPGALPVRFLLACREGHLTDFPWYDFVHRGTKSCKAPHLVLREYGVAGDASDILAECRACKASRRIGDAFDTEFQFRCPGHLPHLRRVEAKPCIEKARPISLGASNVWFPLSMSVLSIPRAGDRLGALVEREWAQLQNITSRDILNYHLSAIDRVTFAAYTPQQVWEAIEAKQGAQKQPDDHAEDLKQPEWQAFCNPQEATPSADFKLSEVAPPKGFERSFEATVLVERLREVRALFGFTRIESNGDFTDATYIEDGRLTPLSRQSLNWLPASETRGEGIFLRFSEDAVQAWENDKAVRRLSDSFLASHKGWRNLRNLEPDWEGFPGIRYVMVHSLAHALMRQIVLDCGYTSASLRERLYCRRPEDEGGPMAGILIYTAASDSEGTLGGLVHLGNPVTLGRHLQQALESLRICASDPLCAEHHPSTDERSVHGASCHACLFASETSCERGNRFLDRSTLIATLVKGDAAFFK